MLHSASKEPTGPRILFVSPAAELGGAERCLIDFVWACRQLDPTPEMRVISLARGPLLSALENEGAQVSVLELPPGLAQLGEQVGAGLRAVKEVAAAGLSGATFMAKLVGAMRSFHPDVVHTNGMKAHLLGAAAAPWRSRLVVHLHDFVSTRALTRLLLPAVAARGAGFIANSQAVADDFRVVSPRARVSVVYNAIDTDYFAPGPVEPGWLAGESGLAPPSPASVSFGLVATYARWKGHYLFLDAIKRFVEARPESPARFYIVGGAVYATQGSQLSRRDLEARIAKLGLGDRVGLIPFQTDIARAFRALNVLVHASTQPEPFGRTVVEAMSTARSVIVSNQGGVRELFNDGETALGFEGGSAEDLCRQMLRLEQSDSLRRELGAAARASAVSRFSRARLTGELAAAFDLG